MSLLITNATVLTVDATDRVIKDGAVFIADGRIAAVGPSAEIEAAHPGAARVIDGGGKVVLPGFVSTHNHVGYTFFRGRAEDMGLGCVTGQYFPMATVASREERLAVGSLTYAELLKSGVTTTLEMEEEADVFAPFVESLGVRSFMGVMTYDVDVDAMAKDEYRYDAALREASQLRQAVEFAQSWHGRAHGRIQVMMTPNMTISSSPELLRASREAADRMGLRTSIHLGWGEYEVDVMQRLRGRTSFEFARDMGMLAADTVCAHCYVVGDSDTDVLAASKASVAHCPLMNAVRGHIAPVVEYRSRGIPVSLGIDNMFADHFEVLRACVSMARIKTGSATVMQSPEVLRLATIAGAEALGMGDEIGSHRARQARRPPDARLPPVRSDADARPGAESRLPRAFEGRGARDGGRQHPGRGLRAENGGCALADRRRRRGGGGGLGAVRREVRRHHCAVTVALRYQDLDWNLARGPDWDRDRDLA